MKRKGIKEFEPVTRKPLTPDQVPALFNKTTHMRYVELQHGDLIQNLLWKHKKIDDVAKELSIDRSTVSKWRKEVRDAIEADKARRNKANTGAVAVDSGQ